MKTKINIDVKGTPDREEKIHINVQSSFIFNMWDRDQESIDKVCKQIRKKIKESISTPCNSFNEKINNKVKEAMKDASLSQDYPKYIIKPSGRVYINSKWEAQQKLQKERKEKQKQEYQESVQKRKEKQKMSNIKTLRTTHEQMKLAVTRAKKVIDKSPPWRVRHIDSFKPVTRPIVPENKIETQDEQYYKNNHWISKNPEGI